MYNFDLIYNKESQYDLLNDLLEVNEETDKKIDEYFAQKGDEVNKTMLEPMATTESIKSVNNVLSQIKKDDLPPKIADESSNKFKTLLDDGLK